jgi:hypothetical protein
MSICNIAIFHIADIAFIFFGLKKGQSFQWEGYGVSYGNIAIAIWQCEALLPHCYRYTDGGAIQARTDGQAGTRAQGGKGGRGASTRARSAIVLRGAFAYLREDALVGGPVVAR